MTEQEKDIREFICTKEEDDTLEFKEARRSLPKEFWETYFSFSNTKGGLIILGIKESRPQNTVVGVDLPEKVLQDMWNTLNNPQKVSFNSLDNNNVMKTSIDGKTIIVIEVEEVNNRLKPVYLNNHLEYAYIRKGSGDYRVTDTQLRAMLRNSNPIGDSDYIKGLNYEAIDPIAVTSFKEKVTARYPNNHFEELTPISFLQRINAIKVNTSGSMEIKKGTLLFFGKYNVIREYFPNYFLDYINRPDSSRWIDRVSTDEISDTQMNIYNFFNIVFDKMRFSILERFKLSDDVLSREKSSGFDEAIREALTNCLAHADYFQGLPTTRIEISKNWISFKNPGEMLVSVESFINGGDSRPRNETIMSFFRYLGLSERQGEGGPRIYQTAIENDYKLPEVETNLEFTELRLWHVDFAEAHPELSDEEREVFTYMYKSMPIAKFSDLRKYTGFTEYRLRKILDKLKEQNLIRIIGNGRSTQYILQDSNRIFEKAKYIIEHLQRNM